MQTDKNDMKVEKSASMHSHAFGGPWKRQIVTDTKSRNALHMFNYASFWDTFISPLENVNDYVAIDIKNIIELLRIKIKMSYYYTSNKINLHQNQS